MHANRKCKLAVISSGYKMVCGIENLQFFQEPSMDKMKLSVFQVCVAVLLALSVSASHVEQGADSECVVTRYWN